MNLDVLSIFKMNVNFLNLILLNQFVYKVELNLNKY